MFSPSLALLAGLLIPTTLVRAQSISGLGVSGGSGPWGGLGDWSNPVRQPATYVTDARLSYKPNSTRQLASGPPPRLLTSGPDSSGCAERREIKVDDTTGGARQEMVGFGHSWTGSTVSVFNTLDNATLDAVMRDLYSQEGNNMGFMRHTIGSSDLDGDQYSYDDNGPSFNEGEPDRFLSNFSLGEHGTAMARYIRMMGDYKGDVFLFGSPWSYPAWAKHNSLFIAPWKNEGSYSNIMNNSFDNAYIPQMVDYFTKYVDAFAEEGVTINGMTLANEPLNSQGGYPCMYLDAVDQAALIAQGVGQAMRARGVKVMAYDHNTDQPMYPMRVMQGAPGLVDAAAWHCYQGPAANYTVLEDWHYAYPDTLQFMTECSNYNPKNGAFNWKVAQNFLNPVKYGASGASMWVMATDPKYGPHSIYGGCDLCSGSIIVNSSSTYTKTNDYYMVGQFSRFIRRGAVNHRITSGLFGTASTPHQLDAIAVRNPDQSWAVVFVNNAGSDQDVVLSFKGSDERWQGTVPNATVTTWLLPHKYSGAIQDELSFDADLRILENWADDSASASASASPSGSASSAWDDAASWASSTTSASASVDDSASSDSWSSSTGASDDTWSTDSASPTSAIAASTSPAISATTRATSLNLWPTVCYNNTADPVTTTITTSLVPVPYATHVIPENNISQA